MNEQIFLNGAPVVGFGSEITDAEERETKGLGVWLLSMGVGAIGGGVIGYRSGKFLGAVGGVVVGSVVGGVAGGVIGAAIASKPGAWSNVGVSAPPAGAAGLPWGEFVASGVVTSLVGLAVEEAVRAVRGRR